MTRNFTIFIFSILCFGQIFGAELSLEEADLFMNKAIEKARELNIKIAVAIVDQHGHLKAFKRMDQATLLAAKSSQMKAYTSSTVPFSTKLIADINAKDPNHALSDIPGLLLLQGGLPIFSPNGEHLGAIGVGGGSGEQDEECAQAALKA